MKFNLKKIKTNLIKTLKDHGIEQTEVNYILCEVLNVNLNKLYLLKNITFFQKLKLNRVVKKRIAGEPLNKIFKKSYFYKNVFYVNKNVLAPRPETEILVEEVLKQTNQNTNVLELCCGSGCVCESIYLNSFCNITASDISSKVLKIAKLNARKLNAKIRFVKSDLFDKISEKYDLIVCNPPYIKTSDIKNLSNEVKNFDPFIALNGGSDGLIFYKKIISEASLRLTNGGKIFFEVGKGQAESVEKIFKKYGYSCKTIKDLSGIKRIIIGEKIC